MNPTELVLSKLPDAKTRGDGWQARCPAHDDHTPSLSIGNGSDGRVLLICHAGCTFSEILAALDLETEDAFSSNGKKPTGRNVIATYDYTDESGALLFQVQRTAGKSFPGRQPDGNGGWIWSLTKPQVKRVLYHLPELVDADPGAWVFVCEGEKSTDAVRSLDLVATCNPHGAGKWRREYSASLAGRRVCIIPDNDPEGENHAGKVASLIRDTVSDVRIVHLPDVTPKKSDPADWVTAGGTRAELLAMVGEAPNLQTVPVFWEKDSTPFTADYIVALESLGYGFRMNTCSDTVEINGEPMSDAIRAKIRCQMRDLNYRRVNVMEDALVGHSYDNSFHPVRDWLDGLAWDGEDHIERLTRHFTDKHGHFYTFLHRWLVGAVARAFEPGGSQNRMMVLDGGQGLGKSFFVRWLASKLERPSLYVEGPINPDDKDCQVRLISAWLWEVSELGSTTRKADREALKYFLSMQQVTVRRPYGRFDLVKPALSSFIGTVNNVSGFLNDPTGHRRYMSVHLKAIDWSYTKLDAGQLWAQAKDDYDNGCPWVLTAQETELARIANAEYEVYDPLDDVLTDSFEITEKPADFCSYLTISNRLHREGWSLRSPRQEAAQIKEALQRLGRVKAGRATDAGKRTRGYYGVRERL